MDRHYRISSSVVLSPNSQIDASIKQKKLSTDKKNKMKANKDFLEKMGYNPKNASLILAISSSRGKHTTTIVCPKKNAVKPFLIINN